MKVSETNLCRAVELLKQGGLVAFPTETYYGIAACAFLERPLARLCRLKERPEQSPFPLLVTGLAQSTSLVDKAVFDLEVFQRLSATFWPGPLTLVLDGNPSLHPSLLGPDRGVAMRVSSLPIAQRLCAELGRPITATSANFRGDAPPTTPTEIVRSGLSRDLDFILEGGQTAGGAPSSVLRLHRNRVELLRSGAVKPAVLQAALDDLGIELIQTHSCSPI